LPGEPVRVPAAVLAEIYAHARETFPDECCGWLRGDANTRTVTRARRAHNAYDPAAHPTQDARSAETAYVIAGPDLLELTRTLDGDEPPLVIYHSHPNGRAYFSDTDQTVARDPWGAGPMYPVQQLVIGIDAERVVEAKLFDWDPSADAFVEIARFEGEP